MDSFNSGRILFDKGGRVLDLRMVMKGKNLFNKFCLYMSLFVSLFAVSSCYDSRATSKVLNEGSKAVDFVLKDISGKTFRLSEQKGKPVLLIFITTWCPSCRSEIPYYKNIYETYGKDGLEVVQINIQESKETASRFAARYGIPFRTLVDARGDVAGAYGIVGIPSMVLIDKEGKILNTRYSKMEGALERLTGKKMRATS